MLENELGASTTAVYQGASWEAGYSLVLCCVVLCCANVEQYFVVLVLWPYLASVRPYLASVRPYLASVRPYFASVRPYLASVRPYLASVRP